MAWDITESKSVNTLSQSGTRHHKVHCVANFALRTEEKGLSYPVLGLTPLPPHFAHSVRNYLNETFPGRWIERGSPRFWAARSRDLTPLDVFAWGNIDSGEQGEDWGFVAPA